MEVHFEQQKYRCAAPRFFSELGTAETSRVFKQIPNVTANIATSPCGTEFTCITPFFFFSSPAIVVPIDPNEEWDLNSDSEKEMILPDGLTI